MACSSFDVIVFVRLDTSSTVNHVNGSTDMFHSMANRKRQGKTGVNSYFERHELAFTRNHWQVM